MSYEPRARTSRRRSPNRPRSRALLGAGATGLALALLASACGSGGEAGASGSDGPIDLGISVPLSGAVGSSCAPMNKAMLAWFKHVNDGGGVNGRKIKIDNRDDGYDAARAVTNTKAFIAKKVDAVTGQCGSLQPPAQVPLLGAAKIPFLFVFGASTKLLDPLNPMYFNLMPTYGEQLVSAVPWVFQNDGTGTVAIMSTTTPDSEHTAAQVSDAVKKAGGTVAGTYTAPPGTADFSPYVLKMKGLRPDYIVLNQIPQDAARFTKAMTAQKLAPNRKLLGSSAVSQDTFLSTVDPAVMPKLVVTSDTLDPASAKNTECTKVLQAAGLKVEGVTLRGCGTAQVVVEALKRVGPNVTGTAIASQLESWKSVKASEIYPELTFSKTDHVGVSSLYVLGVKNGEFERIGQLGG
ncbi:MULTISPECIES: ABC transporter substrate-binding protein [Actinomadura]|uniref:ABC transporter substrate-binding protein n=1 Tax=Actinomadura TaxID=1988 RepID=UPI0003AD6D8B|nr:ABC transporter substrate-binding protein [Actinomadura madurae]SPT63832.1 leucine ABC transporter subunit substrate-binding protein LivK [Actinomadura madurae]